LIGGIGNDLLHGQTGLSSINGGDGDDSLYVDYDGSPLRFQVDGGTGTDLFGISILSFVLAPVLSLDTALAAGATLVNVESLIVWGNHFGNRITGSSRKEQLVGGEGIDQLDGAGGDDVLFAGAGADALSGGADRDYLDGEDGGDALTGGGADDTLVGGAGADRFVYLAASDSTATAYDQLIGFETGVDKIDLGAVAPSSVAWSTTSDGEGRSYNMVTAQSGGGALKIYVHGALAMADFILTQPPRTVIGTSADDVLTGGTGNDRLDGRAGADTMSGGAGDDRYIVDNAGDLAIEGSASGGADSVDSSVAFSLAGQYLENLTLTGAAAIDGTGNGLANVLTGNAAANVLDGGTGGDTMHGGGGNDRYRIDNALDRAMEASASGGTDLVESFVTFSLAGQYLDNLALLGSAAINGTGNGLANVLTGNAAANVLDGGAGADTMTGGAGNDRYIVDNAGDRAVETSASAGTDTVESAVGYSLAGGYVDNLTLTGSAAVSGTGNGLANALSGNNAANRLYGGAGNDSLRGNGGADGFHFDSALNGSTNVDRILDFVDTDDTIFLDRNIFKGIGANGALSSVAFVDGSAATDATDRILYDKASGNIFYDADGTGAAAAVLFAQVSAGTALTPLDFSAYGV
jgi:Ca2+-binding RTX toxin-like protein